MDRAVSSWRPHEVDGWWAELDCRHSVRVREASGGGSVSCGRCDRFELPEGLQLARATPEFTAYSVPAALRRAHRVADGVWGRLVLFEGVLTFRWSAGAGGPAAGEREMRVGDEQPIPPGLTHEVDPGPTARFAVEFWK